MTKLTVPIAADRPESAKRKIALLFCDERFGLDVDTAASYFSSLNTAYDTPGAVILQRRPRQSSLTPRPARSSEWFFTGAFNSKPASTALPDGLTTTMYLEPARLRR